MNRQLWLSYYGDDFTGSTDALEALSLRGLKTVLFLQPPSDELLAERFADLQCLGIAGVSRSMGPTEMEKELTPIFERLQQLGTPIVHYKICSTFDSSPEVGNLGTVIELAKRLYQEARVIPLLAGAPALKRFTVFGNHFATVGEDTFRLDRHPTMSRHPSTPMGESDLRRHLATMSEREVALLDVRALDSGQASERYEQLVAQGPDIVLFDALTDEHICTVGQLLEQESEQGQLLAIGSSGVQYAMTAHWQQSGKLPASSKVWADPDPVDALLVVSGSASPVTESQIAWALDHDFVGIKAPVEQLIDEELAEAARLAMLEQALGHLRAGRSVVVYSAAGPDDPSIERTKTALKEQGGHATDTGKLLGQQLGRLAREAVEGANLKRVVIAGGDTSSYATRELGIYALEMLSPLAPGVPLCRSYSEDSRFDQLEIALKGGQIGQVDFFGRVRG